MKIVRSFFLTMLAGALTLAQTTAPTTNPAEAAAAKDALTRYNTAVEAGDVPQLIASIDSGSETQKKALQMMGKLTTASSNLYKATLEKFGQQELTDNNVNKAAFQGGFPLLPVEQLQVKVVDDKAILSGEDGTPLPLSLVKKDGVWKIDGSILPAFTEQQLKDQSTILEAAISAIDQTRDDVAAGHIRASDEVVVLMQHRAQKAIQKAQLAQLPPELTAPSTLPAGPAAP